MYSVFHHYLVIFAQLFFSKPKNCQATYAWNRILIFLATDSAHIFVICELGNHHLLLTVRQELQHLRNVFFILLVRNLNWTDLIARQLSLRTLPAPPDNLMRILIDSNCQIWNEFLTSLTSKKKKHLICVSRLNLFGFDWNIDEECNIGVVGHANYSSKGGEWQRNRNLLPREQTWKTVI